MDYVVGDELYLWWLANPKAPRLVGTLSLLRTTQGVSLRYSEWWLKNGVALSEDLPLTDIEHRPSERNTAAGAVDDARPDRWGERIIRALEKPSRLSLLEYLYFAGDERFGALGVSTSAEDYSPRRLGPLPTLQNVEQMQELVRKVLANEPVPEAQRRLIAPGTSLGGARPKALIVIDGVQWVVKFSEGDPTDVPLVEHACMTLASKAGIDVARTRAIRLVGGHAVAVLRFDRAAHEDGQLRRLHAQSAHVALRAEASEMGYPELAQLIRRRGRIEGGAVKAQMKELFVRMVFNIFIDNTDDHEKNHVLLMDDMGHLDLAPAFDVVCTGQSLRFQQMRVGRAGADSTIDNAFSDAGSFGLSERVARQEAARIARVCDGWQRHFKAAGVTAADIDYWAPHLDSDFLREQRRQAQATAKAAKRPRGQRL